jgi:hypothetical protein
MLVAKRDPFHDAHDTTSIHAAAPHAPAPAPKLARAMGAIQIVGTLLAIPVGLGSAYSMYRANFSVETSCQTLRANIVTMLDKRVDATARHRLVRRDVEAFERSCGSVDPDATAAFKELLAVDQKPVAVVRAVDKPVEIAAPKIEYKTESKVETKTEPKAEPRAIAAIKPVHITTVAKTEAAAVKAEGAAVAKTETETAERDAQSSDAAWLAAVRGALVTHASPAAPASELTEAAPPKLAPVAPPSREAHSLGTLPPRSAAIAAPAPAHVTPLPAETWSATVAAPAADAGHPVPPATIPVVVAVPKEPAARSRLGELVAQIPLIGSMIEP